jgi:DNA-binding NtrC family response regulator
MPNLHNSHNFSEPTALLGPSPDAARARASWSAAVRGRAPLLLLAETGFDVAAIARTVHDASDAARPFVHVNASQADASEIEMQLFGTRHRPAARTAEVVGAGGALVRANSGTLFIEAIGGLPFPAQRRLARLLRDGEARVGGRATLPLQARIIASTLPGPDVDGEVLADLHRRLSAQVLTVPPLRTRPADFGSLVAAVARDISGQLSRAVPSFTQSAINVLASLPWRRNMQELEALLERLLRAVPGGTVQQEDVLAQLSFDGAFARRAPVVSLREARQRFERDYIAAVLEQHDWRMSDAARTLGMERANLYRKARQLGISR